MFSVDSIITAVGMTDHLAIMYIAVMVAITVMLVAATPLADFIEKNPTIVMLALGFLLMIGTTLIADGFGFHVPEGLHLLGHGFLGAGRGSEHAFPSAQREGASIPGGRNRSLTTNCSTAAGGMLPNLGDLT